MEKTPQGHCLEGHNQRAIQSALETQHLCPVCMQNLLRRWLSTYGVAEVLVLPDVDKFSGYYTNTVGNPHLTTLVEDTSKVLGR